MVACPRIDATYQNGLWPPGLLPADYPTPAAFANTVLTECATFHASNPGYLITAFEVNSGAVDWPAQTFPLGAYAYPSGRFKVHRTEALQFQVSHVNPWAVVC